MTTRSAKAKGKRLQNELRQMLLETFTELSSDDIKSAIASEGGEDLKLSPAARALIPIAFECKNTEKIAIWQALQQAEKNANGYNPVVVFSKNRAPIKVALDLSFFLKLLNRASNASMSSKKTESQAGTEKGHGTTTK